MDNPDSVIPNCMIITNIKNGITVLKINVDRVFARSMGNGKNNVDRVLLGVSGNIKTTLTVYC